MQDYMLRLAEQFFKTLDKLGVDEAEFYGSWRRNLLIDISGDRVNRVSIRVIGEYGVRASIGKKVAGISSSNLSPDVEDLSRRLAKIIKASPEDKDWPGFSKGYRRGVLAKIYDEKLAAIPVEEVIERLKGYMDESREAARSRGSESTIIPSGMVSLGSGGIIIANNLGEHLYDEATSIMLYYEVKSRRNGEEASYETVYVGTRLDEERILREARRGGEYSVLFIGARPVGSGSYNLLLDQYNAAAFAETVLSPAFSALNVQENRSPLKDRLGQTVISENLSIIDDPSIDWGVGSRSFDDEGVPTRRKYVINNGVLETYLYDYYTASRAGLKSTGNGFRRNPGSPPHPGPTNLVFEADKTWGWDEMVSEMRKGLIVHGMIGYWMSNPVNGATQATISHGLLVENGEVKHPVKGVVIGGNMYDWLGKDLVGVGRELLQVGSIYMRPILVGSVRVAGK